MTYTWQTIGDLCSQDRTIVPSGSPLAKDLPFLGLEHVESVTGRIQREALVNTNGGGNAFLFDSRHVLYSKLRPYLNKVAVPDFAGRCTTELIPLLPKASVSRDYLAWLLRKPQTVQAAMQGKTGARMPRADIRHVLAQRVLVPDSIEEQNHLADEIAQRMEIIARTRSACMEQLQILDAITQKSLFEFPASETLHSMQ